MHHDQFSIHLYVYYAGVCIRPPGVQLIRGTVLSVYTLRLMLCITCRVQDVSNCGAWNKKYIITPIQRKSCTKKASPNPHQETFPTTLFQLIFLWTFGLQTRSLPAIIRVLAQVHVSNALHSEL